MYQRYIKPILDLVLSGLALLLLSPVILVTAVLVRIKLGPPVFFCQQRPGLHGEPFKIYKFRTMRDAYGEDGKLLPDAHRLTSLGTVLRQASIDELPELFNVLRGDMSLVGPRPLMTAYLKRYTPKQNRRHDVKPGITGWAQINGRNALLWEEKFELDVWYVDHCSLLLDIQILLRTIWKVIKREGISAEGHSTMPEFLGTSVSRSSEEGIRDDLGAT